MTDQDLEDTKPRRVKQSNDQTSGRSGSKAVSDTQPTRVKRATSTAKKTRRVKSWQQALLAAMVLSLAVSTGALAGYRSARQTILEQETGLARLSLEEQYKLGQEDLADGRYEVARQRFEYILSMDPAYPGVADRLAEALAVLYATATPTPLPPTITATSTRDIRPVEDMLKQALTLFANQDWSGAIDTLVALRKADPNYQVTQVDGLLFLALRNRGVAKILNEGNLAGGIYDLALAEHFGPLDVEALNPREWARLYMIGLSFWEVHPEQAVYYFGQVAAAVPGLRDSDNWTANERYRTALIQYGDMLAGKQDWCGAKTQYELAMAIRQEAEVAEKLTTAAQQCGGWTLTPTPTGSAVLTPTPTMTPPTYLTPTPTNTIVPVSPTATQPIPPTPTPTEVTQPTPTSTEAQPPPEPTATFTSPAPYPPPAPAAQVINHQPFLISMQNLIGWIFYWL